MNRDHQHLNQEVAELRCRSDHRFNYVGDRELNHRLAEELIQAGWMAFAVDGRFTWRTTVGYTLTNLPRFTVVEHADYGTATAMAWIMMKRSK